jgi:hypothetical protein
MEIATAIWLALLIYCVVEGCFSEVSDDDDNNC